MKVSFVVVAVVAVVVGVVTHQVASHGAVDDALAMLADPAFQADLATIERAMWLPYKGDEEAAVVAPSESKDGVPCALCSIALNEVEGLLAENLTMADLQTAIKNDVCAHAPKDLEVACDLFVEELPQIVDGLESRVHISQDCVKLGFCETPQNHNEPLTMDVPHYTINLDLPPEQRFVEVCSNATYAKSLNDMFDWLASGLEDGGAKVIEFGDKINSLINPEYAAELTGCAKAMKLEPGWLAFIQVAYTASDACTSFVTQDSSGVVSHFRNIDFWAGSTDGLTATLKNVTYIAHFEQNGKEVYRVSALAGMQGALSGMNSGFSVTVNTRFVPGGIKAFLEMVVKDLVDRDATLILFLTRDVLASGADYKTAVSKLSTTPITADVYYTVSGVASDEGIVIARDPTGVFNSTSLDVASGKWFVAVTNWPWWEPQPWIDNRLDPLVDRLHAIGQSNIDVDAGFNLLSEKPTLNIQTVYSYVGITANQTYGTWTRFCPWPCVE